MKTAPRPNPTIDLAQARLDAERWLDEGGSFRSEAVSSTTTGHGLTKVTTRPAERLSFLAAPAAGKDLMRGNNSRELPILRRRPLIAQVIKRRRSIEALRVRGANPPVIRRAKVVA